MTIRQVFEAIDKAAPFSLAMDFDNVGILVGDEAAEVTGVLAALDITVPVIEEAAARGANLIVSHHPVIFNPLKRLTPEEPAYHLVKHGIAAVCAHTNLDIAEGGVNDVLASLLDLQQVTVLPPDNLIRVGRLSRGMTPAEFAYYVKEKLNLPALRYNDGGRVIERVAVCGGSCGSLLYHVSETDCQALFTGEIKHDLRLYANQRGLTVLDAGHFLSENVVMGRLLEVVKSVAPETMLCEEARGNRCPETTI